ncbi:hypothetical protein [Ruegeria sp. ANG-R]|uniref:hypothetical protein n=1 Tax=Ruegeria sp. ANG-R TaxID=1577903 RepID=UPI000691D9B3|nr:hypothetical protein [Ruegeria sp. ANG-R]
MSILQRFAPALLLLIISPLIAEFLLGDFNVRQFAYLGIFIPLYGALALFVRELVRRSGRGWVSMLVMALVCGLIYEGLVNQTLFNPHFAGADLLKYGYVEALGTSFNYAAFILTLHTVWSISTPIAIAEGFAGERAREPWLNRPLLAGTGLLALLGLAGTTASTIERYKFVSSPLQYGSVVVLILILTFLAFRIVRKPGFAEPSNTDDHGSKTWMVIVFAFALSSAFMIWFHYAPDHKINSSIGLAVFLGIDVIALFFLSFWSRQASWNATHIVAAATGAVLTYTWFGLWRFVVDGKSAMGIKTEPIDIVGQVCLALALIGVCWLAIHRQTNVRTGPKM